MTDSQDLHLTVFDTADGALQERVTRNMTLAGQAANHHAARGVFADYLSRKADNTIRRQAADLARFADYLNAIGEQAGVELGSALARFAQAIADFPDGPM